MLLEDIGWHEAADAIRNSINKTITNKRVTMDLAMQIPGAEKVGCQEFGEIVLANL